MPSRKSDARKEAVQLDLAFERRDRRRARGGAGQLVFPLEIARQRPRPGFEGLKRLRRLLAAQIGTRPG